MTFLLFAFFIIYLELLGQVVLCAAGVALCWLIIVAIERSFRYLRARVAVRRSLHRGTWLIIRDSRRALPIKKSTYRTFSARIQMRKDAPSGMKGNRHDQ